MKNYTIHYYQYGTYKTIIISADTLYNLVTDITNQGIADSEVLGIELVPQNQ